MSINYTGLPPTHSQPHITTEQNIFAFASCSSTLPEVKVTVSMHYIRYLNDKTCSESKMQQRILWFSMTGAFSYMCCAIFWAGVLSPEGNTAAAAEEKPEKPEKQPALWGASCMERMSDWPASILLAEEEAAAAEASLADPKVAGAADCSLARSKGAGAARRLLLWTQAAGAAGAANSPRTGPWNVGAARIPPAVAEVGTLVAEKAAVLMGWSSHDDASAILFGVAFKKDNPSKAIRQHWLGISSELYIWSTCMCNQDLHGCTLHGSQQMRQLPPQIL